MLLAILTNIHFLATLGLWTFLGCGFVYLMFYLCASKDEWNEVQRRIPTQLGKFVLITALSLVALYCVTPSSSDVMTYKIGG